MKTETVASVGLTPKSISVSFSEVPDRETWLKRGLNGFLFHPL